jgi:carbon-monoxide dehydrogenase small subunit
VLLDGRAVNSCITLAVQANGSEVTTIEGLETADCNLHPLQQAFIDHGAIQCGFCTPGMVLSAKALLDENPRPTELEVRGAIAGNICRCTGYKKIVEAILAARDSK